MKWYNHLELPGNTWSLTAINNPVMRYFIIYKLLQIIFTQNSHHVVLKLYSPWGTCTGWDQHSQREDPSFPPYWKELNKNEIRLWEILQDQVIISVVKHNCPVTLPFFQMTKKRVCFNTFLYIIIMTYFHWYKWSLACKQLGNVALYLLINIHRYTSLGRYWHSYNHGCKY